MRGRNAKGDALPKKKCVPRHWRYALWAMILMAGSAWINRSATAQVRDQPRQGWGAAWHVGAERIIEVLDFRGRYDAWVDSLADGHIAQDTTLAEQRETLAGVVRANVPWDSVHLMLVGAVGWVAIHGASDVEAPGVPLIVDEIVQWLGSPFGAATLDLALSPDVELLPPRSLLELLVRRFPEQGVELEVFLESYPGAVIDGFASVVNLGVWPDVRSAGQRALATFQGRGPRR